MEDFYLTASKTIVFPLKGTMICCAKILFLKMRHHHTLCYPLHNSHIEFSSMMKGLTDSAMDSSDFTLKME